MTQNNFQHQFWLECADCGHRVLFVNPQVACEQCGGKWLDARYDYNTVQKEWPATLRERPFDMWRYRELLPLLSDTYKVTKGEGGTPLLHAVNLGLMLGCPHIYVKDERQGPTGSFKDRQASLAISVMKEHGVTEAIVASTGNVAISYSAYSAQAGIKMWTFLTSLVPSEKMQEVALYGSEVIKVTGTYDQTKKVAADFAARKGIFLDRGIRGISAREAMKTLAFEIAEQLPALVGPAPPIDGKSTPWRSPDWYFQAVSGGMGPVGVWKAFEEMFAMGLVDRMPKLANVQASGCAPMVHSFDKGLEEAEPVLNPQTRVITIATGTPGPAYKYLSRAVRDHGGAFTAVTDEETFRAMHVMAKLDGISMEPASAAAFAAVFKLLSEGVIKRDQVIVVNCSGHTFPVEKHLLGDEWARTVEMPTETEGAPQVRSKAVEEGLLGSLEQLDGRVRSIAIMEDDPQARLLLRRILQTRGEYRIFEASDGASGLDMVRRERPDVILMDLMMPGMDGFEVLEALKSDEQLTDVPVIVISAKELTVAERKRLGSQTDMLMQKGDFTDEELLEEILKRAS
ncbi:MAG: pyridoxal-phosphate dependent enzyme [Chloroflexi bacterium]|nr:pyridoxal-phosphate dependent enzyme [Chloroflexota bacterium]